MEERYESSLTPEQEAQLSQLLKSVPDAEPTAGFEDRLMANIRRIDDGETVELLTPEPKKRSIWVTALSAAAGLAMAVILINGFTGTPEKTDTQIAKQPVKSDSTETKNFKRPLNLVGEEN